MELQTLNSGKVGCSVPSVLRMQWLAQATVRPKPGGRFAQISLGRGRAFVTNCFRSFPFPTHSSTTRCLVRTPLPLVSVTHCQTSVAVDLAGEAAAPLAVVPLAGVAAPLAEEAAEEASLSLRRSPVAGSHFTLLHRVLFSFLQIFLWRWRQQLWWPVSVLFWRRRLWKSIPVLVWRVKPWWRYAGILP